MRHFTLFLVLFIFVQTQWIARSYSFEVQKIDRFKVKLSKKLIEASGGYPTGIGSGLTYARKGKNGNILFYSITDRGPNAFLKELSKLIAFHPTFSPKIIEITVDGKQAHVSHFLNIKKNGKEITGLPMQTTTIKTETLWNENLNQISAPHGMDTESIALLPNGDFVVGEEYLPSIAIIDKETGNIKTRFIPGDGLPKALEHRQLNCGFEAVAVTPNGKIYALLQNTMDVNGKTKDNASFIRMVELDPDTKTNKMFAYPIHKDPFLNLGNIKIGDLAAIDNHQFLLVEQGPTKEGYANLIYHIDIKDADDISNIEEQTLLESVSKSSLSRINMVKKSFILNPRAHGWESLKLEGLTILDNRTLALINDNDFGLTGSELFESMCHNMPCKKAKPILESANFDTNLWIFTFNKALF